MTRILITGAAGLVGRALLDELSDHQVFATDLRRPDTLPDEVPFLRLDVTTGDPATPTRGRVRLGARMVQDVRMAPVGTTFNLLVQPEPSIRSAFGVGGSSAWRR